ncbi:MAG: radical SAM protein [Polyangiaceae bacterium]
MAVSSKLRERIRTRLADEVGRLGKSAPYVLALCYPSPYAAGMSSLGYQRIYRLVQETPGFACERAFLDDEGGSSGAPIERPVTYESLSPLESFPVVAFSVAYELEIAGLIRMLEAASIPVRRTERDDRHPFVLAGGPLTFSNPTPLGGLVDAVVMGESEDVMPLVLEALRANDTRQGKIDALSRVPSVWLPDVHGDVLAPIAAADDAALPAWAPIRSPHAEFADMFLVESERGCSRGCRYCVMRRSTNGGMRLAPMQRILELIPEDAKRVGLVGAAVSDHPKIVDIVNTLADQGREVGLSSLRPDRLSDEFVGALKRGGYRTLTTAMDGTSERVRETLERRARPKHLLKCAEMAKKHGMDRLKLYLMVGVPGETDADIDECAAFTSELSRIVPVALGIAPFCAKRNTPLDGAEYAGIDVVNDRLDRLRRGLKGRADVRSTSAKWAWVEYVLAQGGQAEGLAVIDAVHGGSTFAAYKKAFDAVGRTDGGPDSKGRGKRRHLTMATAV